MKLKYTKWHKYKFTDTQMKARRMWNIADEYYFELVDVLRTSPDGQISREQFHEKLDMVLDVIEKNRAGAIVLFPEVKESFTISEGRFK